MLRWAPRLGTDWNGRALFADQVALLHELGVETRGERELYFELISEWSAIQAEREKERE